MKVIIDKIRIPIINDKIAVLSDIKTRNKGEIDEHDFFTYYFELHNLLKEGKNYRIQITQLD